MSLRTASSSVSRRRRAEAALDRFCEVADGRRFGIEGVYVVADGGHFVERRWIADIRRDVFSVSKTVTSLAIGMLAHDGLLTLDDPVLMHLPELADTAAPGTEAMTVRHLLSMTAGNGYRWLDEDADHPGDPARDFLATPLVAQPGTAFDYRGGNSYVSTSSRRCLSPIHRRLSAGVSADSAQPDQQGAQPLTGLRGAGRTERRDADRTPG